MALQAKDFWARKQGPDLAAEVHRKVKRYFDACEAIGVTERLREQYRKYFMQTAIGGRSSSVLDTGTRKNPEVRIQVPEMRSLIRQQLAFLLAEPIGFQCVASTGEQRSVMASEVGDKVVNYLYKENIHPSLIDVAENLIVYGSTGSHLRWDREKGDDVIEEYETELTDKDGNVVPKVSMSDEVDEAGNPVPNTDEQGNPLPLIDDTTGKVVPEMTTAQRDGKSGAPYREALDPTMFAYDPIMGLKAGWCVAFERTNLYVLASKYPENPQLQEMILNQSCTDKYQQYRFTQWQDSYGADEGDIVILHFYYADSTEIRGGRHVIVLDSDVIDMGACPLPAGRLPLRILLNSKYTDNALSFADSAALGPIEETLNRIRSAELNNFAYYGKQTTWREETTRVVAAEQLSGGTREYVGPRGSQMPMKMPINPMPSGSKDLKEDMIEALSRTSGFGDVSRGTVEDTTSGAHAAVFEAITARNLSLPEQQIVTLETEVANDTLDMTRNFGNVEFVAEIAGKGGSPLARSFAPEDLGTLRRVVAIAVPDAMKGSLARIKLVELTKDIQDPRERAKAVQMVTRGDDEYGKNDSRKLNLIAVENERLLNGEEVEPDINDDHYGHNQDHQAAYDEYRTQPNPDPKVLMAFQSHVIRHGDLLQVQDPIIARTLGYPEPPVLPGNPAEALAMRLADAQNRVHPQPPPGQEPSNGPPSKSAA